MKLILLSVCLIFLMLPVSAREGQLMPPLARTVAYAQTNRTQIGLYETIYNQLQQYYGRTDFADPDRTSGWYRVGDFLTWLKQNETALISELKQVDFPLQQPQTLWIYLGARYAADIYRVRPDFTRLNVQARTKDENICARMEDTTILFDPFSHQTIAAAITLGLHEGTHILPALLQNTPATSLSELASFYSQHEYGLPVKVEDANSFGYGVRDIRLTSYRKGFSLVPLTYEYMLHIVGLVLLPELSTEELLMSHNDLSNPSDFNLATAIIYWHALSKGQLFVNHQSYTADLYLKRLLGALTTNAVLYKKAYEFLVTLDRNLPQEIQQQIQGCFPIAQEDSSCVKQVTEFLHQNPRLVIKSVTQALQDVNAPLQPPVPHGYL